MIKRNVEQIDTVHAAIYLLKIKIIPSDAPFYKGQKTKKKKKREKKVCVCVRVRACMRACVLVCV